MEQGCVGVCDCSGVHLCPSGDTSRGWAVQLPDGRLLTTAKCFPAPSDEQNLEVKVLREPLGAAVPTLREKVTLRKLAEWLPEEDDLSAVDRFAKELQASCCAGC